MIVNKLIKLSSSRVLINYFSSKNISNLKVYNNLTKNLQNLQIKNSNVLYWYNCGPTVYDSAHIGHASCYMSYDIIRRILKNYYQVNIVDLMNITDIDDKIINKAKEQNKGYKEIANYYENEFLVDLANLNIERPSIILRVTDYIPQIIKFIEKLIQSNNAYVAASGSVYFNTVNYPKRFFSINQLDQLVKETEINEKLNENDFVLWKAKKAEDEPSWLNPFSSIGGRPGWHIECSTLANIAFGNHLDIHSGGKDLIFPHHENELIQCCAYHNIDNWAKLWLHYGHLHLKGDLKMSKSLKNTITIQEMLKKYSADEFRLFCLISNYRNDKEYSDEQMTKPTSILKIFNSFIEFTNAYCNGLSTTMNIDLNEIKLFEKLEAVCLNVDNALNDDFNTNLAIHELLDLVNYMNKIFKSSHESSNKINTLNSINSNYGSIMAVSQYVKLMLNIFGLNTGKSAINDKKESQLVNNILDSSIKFRNQIRMIAKEDSNKENKIKLLKVCDEFRDDLKVKGSIVLKDYKDKTTWSITSGDSNK